MRDPDQLISLPSIIEGRKDVIKLDSVPEYDIENWDLNNEKDFKAYIKVVERSIRTSFEYRNFIGYVREYGNMDHCAILPRVNNDETFKIHIEIHHEPFTLYDIVMAVFRKRMAMREDLSEYMVAKEVMYYHYRGYVGLIPLSETVHELVHNMFIFIPCNIVFGRWNEFRKLYEPYIEMDTLVILDKIEKLSKNYDLKVVRNILDPYIVELEQPNNPDKGEILEFVKNKLNEYNASLVA